MQSNNYAVMVGATTAGRSVTKSPIRPLVYNSMKFENADTML